MPRFRPGRYKGQRLKKLKRGDFGRVKKLLQGKLGEYTKEDFEKFINRYQPKDQEKIRQIERDLLGGIEIDK